jgi:hypothetical protein
MRVRVEPGTETHDGATPDERRRCAIQMGWSVPGNGLAIEIFDLWSSVTSGFWCHYRKGSVGSVVPIKIICFSNSLARRPREVPTGT